MEKHTFEQLQQSKIDWDHVHGPVAIRLTNDYLFRALLQRNNHVLKALTCSLLHLEMSEVSSVVITNPIELGKTIEDKEFPEFYATYWMMNEKTHRIYSDKIRLSVLDLTQIELATEEDKRYKIDYWARLFRSTTWEEIKMLAKSDEYLQEAAACVYELTQDEEIRQRCEAREDYYRRTAGKERKLKEAQEEVKREKKRADEAIERAEREAEEKRQLSEEVQRLQRMLLENGIPVENNEKEEP